MTRLSCIIVCLAWMPMSGCTPEDDAVRADDEQPQVIPLPNRVAMSPGAFILQRSTVIAPGESRDARRIAPWFADLLRRGTGLAIAVDEQIAAPSRDAIRLRIGEWPDDDAGAEAYRLSVSPDAVTVTGADAAGLFYGAVSLWQLATAGDRSDGTIAIPAMQIEDAPAFAWRGLMLDTARHFIPPASVKDMIDWMALHKLNVLHWHLTDDQGWRLEIDAYPRLTRIGAWRTPAGRAAGRDIDPATGEPRQYGGFYTKDEVRDIVEHAAQRHVTVVPEIEMPGHAQAAIAAYPEWGVGDAPPGVSSDWGIHDYLFNVEESTFDALETILAEVIALFPSRYIHVGGDEAVKKRWVESERVQERMRELGVTDETALQSYFVKRIEHFLSAHDRRLIGWDEILEGGIAPEATVMSWRGIDGALTAAALGHDAVLSPWPTLYFDHRQGGLPQEPPGRGTIVSLEDVYHFDPLPSELRDAGGQHVLGLQANVWTEHIRTPERVAYMSFPRAAAMAEVAWSQPERRNWPRFVARLAAQFERYRKLGVPFATTGFDVHVTAVPRPDDGSVKVTLSNQSGYGEIRYSLDGGDVTTSSPRYEQALDLAADTVLSAATFIDGRRMSRTAAGDVGQMARRRYSQELEPCTDRIVLSLEDDAPVDGDRSVFLIDIMNPCWIWRGADLTGISGIEATVGQVPFNFQIGEQRDRIVLPEPSTPGGELRVRKDGCDGVPIAVLPLAEATASDRPVVLSREFTATVDGNADLCFRIAADDIDPLWAIDRIELLPSAAH